MEEIYFFSGWGCKANSSLKTLAKIEIDAANYSDFNEPEELIKEKIKNALSLSKSKKVSIIAWSLGAYNFLDALLSSFSDVTEYSQDNLNLYLISSGISFSPNSAVTYGSHPRAIKKMIKHVKNFYCGCGF